MNATKPPGMRVEMPRLLSLVAHEVRGPLGVIQGYLRLMTRARAEGNADLPLLNAMLDATGRLAAISRQASELASWTERYAGMPASLTAHALMDLVRTRPGWIPATTVDVDEAISAELISSANPDMLAASIAGVIDATRRELGANVALRVSVVQDEAPDAVVVTIAPAAVLPEDLRQDAERPFQFDQGGLGLALVLASYVLEAHEARVTVVGSSGAARIRLQKERGPA
jgi:signal transduction histidine kinase